MPANQLPGPMLTEAATLCVSCGYSLDGLQAPGQCPECSAHFESRQLVLCGVPNRRSGGSWWRRLAWGLVIGSGLLLSQIGVLLFMVHWIVLVVYILAVIGGAAALLISGPRERRGTERFVVSPGGISRVAMDAGKDGTRMDSVFIPWSSGAVLHIQAISNVWVRIRIGTRPDRRGIPSDLDFDAGVRCPAASLERVRTWIESCIRGDASAREVVPRDPSEPPPIPIAP